MSFKAYAQLRRDSAGFVMTVVAGPGQVSEHALPAAGKVEFSTNAGNVSVTSDDIVVRATMTGTSGRTMCNIPTVDIPASGHSKVRYFNAGGSGNTSLPRALGTPAAAPSAPVSASNCIAATPSTAKAVPAPKTGIAVSAVAELIAAVADVHNETHPGPFQWCEKQACRAARRIDITAV